MGINLYSTALGLGSDVGDHFQYHYYGPRKLEEMSNLIGQGMSGNTRQGHLAVASC